VVNDIAWTHMSCLQHSLVSVLRAEWRKGHLRNIEMLGWRIFVLVNALDRYVSSDDHVLLGVCLWLLTGHLFTAIVVWFEIYIININIERFKHSKQFGKLAKLSVLDHNVVVADQWTQQTTGNRIDYDWLTQKRSTLLVTYRTLGRIA